MDNSSDKNPGGDSEKAAPEVSSMPANAPSVSPLDISAPAIGAVSSDLPMVEAPKLAIDAPIATSASPKIEPVRVEPVLGAPKADAPKISVGEPVVSLAAATSDSGESEKDSAPETAGTIFERYPDISRFGLLAASIAIAAAFGSIMGSLTTSGVQRLFAVTPAKASTEQRDATAREVLQSMRAELAELTALKASIESAARSNSAQFAKIADRLDRADRAAADPAAKIGHISETVDRLERRAGAPDTTGTVASAASSPDPKLYDRVPGWVLRDVQGGRALVVSRYGALFDVGPGNMLPGLGRVEAIKRQDGQWVVVTAHGVITASLH
jgi:hypothetical protein